MFGPAWADTDRNGCDTRNDLLRRDLTGAAQTLVRGARLVGARDNDDRAAVERALTTQSRVR